MFMRLSLAAAALAAMAVLAGAASAPQPGIFYHAAPAAPTVLYHT
jgi:hypothetical protein